jgi:hypothetical protein
MSALLLTLCFTQVLVQKVTDLFSAFGREGCWCRELLKKEFLFEHQQWRKMQGRVCVLTSFAGSFGTDA